MARYNYTCANEKCSMYKKTVEVVKPMMESSKTEFCEECEKELQRDYKGGAIVTGDGVKH
jgi:hypothetical protein